MRFASLGSGSRGNGTLVETANACVLVDCGFSLKETVKRLERVSRTPADLDAILVTHEHSDHISGVATLAKRHAIPFYASYGTAEYKSIGESEWFRPIDLHAGFKIEDMAVTPVAVPHDAREPCQFVFRNGSETLGLLTDLGSITPWVCEQYLSCDALLLECNHDEEMLQYGPYPPALKRRVAGDWGHLSNRQSAALLARLETDQLRLLAMAHLSEQNNTVELAGEAIAPLLGDSTELILLDQDDGSGWHSIN